MAGIDLHAAANTGRFGSGRFGSGREALVRAGAWGGPHPKRFIGGFCLTEGQERVASALGKCGEATTETLAQWAPSGPSEEGARAWAGRHIR